MLTQKLGKVLRGSLHRHGAEHDSKLLICGKLSERYNLPRQYNDCKITPCDGYFLLRCFTVIKLFAYHAQKVSGIWNPQEVLAFALTQLK